MYVRPRPRFRPRNAGGVPFSPALLFTSGVAGAWYDPSDVLLNWRTNLLTYSQEFDNAAWTKAQTTISANAVTAPDGTLTADKMVETAVTNVHGAYQTFTYVSGATYSASVYAKQAERSWIYLGADTAAAEAVFFDLANGTVGAQGTGYVGSIQSVGDGWYRCTVTITQSTALPPNYFVVGVTTANNTTSYLGDITKGVYLWGAQLELGSTATTYQAITTLEQTYLLYDPQPVLYQDSAGTTPVTAVEQPVGLMLDKSQGLVLGSELVTNPGPFTTTTDWTGKDGGSLSVVNSKLRITSSAAYSRASTGFTTVIGRSYKFTATIESVSGTSNQMYIQKSDDANGAVNAVPGNSSGSRTATLIAVATATTTYISLVNGPSTNPVVDWSNISVREIAGNHASQATAASRPVLRARYNQLTYSEQFDNAAWGKTNVTVSANAAVAPDGTTTADLLYPSSTGINRWINSSSLATVAIYTYSIRAKYSGIRWLYILKSDGSAGAAWFDVQNGVVGTVAAGYTASITATSNGYYVCSVTTPAAAPSFLTYTGLSSADNSLNVTANGTDGIYIWGADLRTGSSAGTYQRIAAATDYATAGFLPYLSADGVDDQMSSGNINLTGTDKLTAVFGSFTNSTANQGVFQFGASGAGTMNALYMAGATTDMRSSLQGSTGTSQMRITGTGLGVAAVYSELYNIAGATAADESQIRLNGTLPTQTVQSAGPADGGNFANTALSILQFGSVFFLNGRLYGLVFCGKTLSASELSATEAWMNSKTGAY